MKISINSKFLEGPYGGGMQFANFLREFLFNKGHVVINHLNDPDIDIILHVNPFPHLTPEASAYSYKSAHLYKKARPETIIIERINECDERKGTDYINKLLVKASTKSDFVVFIASWLRPLMLKAGLPKDRPWSVILNGADNRIFNTKGKKPWDGKEKLKIVTHHWSDNPKKGHAVYRKIDELLGSAKYGDLFEFTYIGRVPKGTKYENTRVVAPLSGIELAEELKKHHVYITASENEPAGMHHIEAALCGLPLLYINSGALPEYCEGFGIEFDSANLSDKLLEMRERYMMLSEKIKNYGNTAEKMAEEYLDLFEELYANRRDFAPKKKLNPRKFIPKFLKYPLISTYILYRSIMRGLPAEGIRLNFAGVLPKHGEIVHGGKVKLLPLREKFGDTWRRFNIAYFVSSGLPFAPQIWIKIYKLFGIKIAWNQNGVAYPALYEADIVSRINKLMKPMHLSDYVIYQTEFVKKCADKYLGEYNGPSSVLVNPVDTDKFRPGPTAQPVEPLVIIMSGHHFESEERMRISLESIKKVREMGVETKLIIIGKAETHIDEDWVEMTGAYLQQDAPRLYRRAHMLLHLKYLDPCPTIILEALACGLPVVAQANGGLPEMVDDKSGVLIPVVEDFDNLHYPSVDDVVSAILKVRDNYREYSKGARSQSLKFDRQKWLEKHEKIFNNLLK